MYPFSRPNKFARERGFIFAAIGVGVIALALIIVVVPMLLGVGEDPAAHGGAYRFVPQSQTLTRASAAFLASRPKAL